MQRKLYREKKQELADAQAEYEDGKREYEEGLQEYEEKIAEAEKELSEAEEEVADIEEPDVYLLGRDTNVGYVCFESDSNIVDGIANVFPVFFFLVAALVCITTMNRMVEEQRTQIGVLKALGYSDRTIVGKYIFYSGSAAVSGCVFGYVAGSILFPKVIWTGYGIMYSVESVVYVFNGFLAVIALVCACLCSVGATFVSCRVELSQVAAVLMRPKAPKAGKRVLFEYIPFLWKRLRFLQKVSVRNIFRYKKRLVMMVLGISGCTALVVAGFGIEDSIANVATQQFEEIQIYDMAVTFADVITAEEEALLEALGIGAERYAPVLEDELDVVTEEGRKSVSLLVYDANQEMEEYLNLHTSEEEPIPFPANGEIVLTEKCVEDLKISLGDKVSLQDDDGSSMSFTVGASNENFIFSYVYMNEETYEAATGEKPQYKTVYVNLQEGEDAHLLAASLMKEDGVASVTVNADTMERFSSMMKSLDLIVFVVICCAAGLAFIVLYNLTNINITERVREIATIKVLGFYKQESSSYVFRENTWLTALGTILGLVLGHFLHLFIMSQIKIDMVTFDVQVRPISYVYSAILTFLFSWAVNRMMSGKLEKISMTESLKSVD